MLPLLKDLMNLDCPATMQGIARILSETIYISDCQALGAVLSLVPDVNSPTFLKWLSPAHQIVLEMTILGVRDSARYLLAHGGLNLHLVAFVEPFYPKHWWWWSNFRELGLIRGNTPTSMAIRYSSTFFKFRNLLLEVGVEIENFVNDEPPTPPLAEEGWTRETLLFLFRLDFRPLELSQCQSVVSCQTYVSPIDAHWLSALEELRSGNIQRSNELFEARDQNMLDSPMIHRTLCQSCFFFEKRRIPAREDGHYSCDEFEDENSPFLLSL
ncbi:hypothetical protein ONS95_014696 [Cadophora gregata]|uniref:uncharacterized protein n=1 Tax=Cadophora gregata TaxID=51156 RepID=UPI0026DD9E6A|nr:uncharacterized protein ONS95_014696 [Cadophora gregata]KAK0112982.1 hypothetical protein ONS95_014696 [Cadophora gregata]